MLKRAMVGSLLGIITYLIFLNTNLALIMFGLAGVIEFGAKYLVVKYLLNKEYESV